MRLLGRKALITGTATGIGREIAIRFAGEGAHVIAVDWDDVGNRETTERISSAGGAWQVFKADISSESEVVALFRSAGYVDILEIGRAHV